MNSNLVVNGLITRATDLAGNGLEILNADLAYGLPKENLVISRLSEYFNEKIDKAEYQDVLYKVPYRTYLCLALS